MVWILIYFVRNFLYYYIFAFDYSFDKKFYLINIYDIVAILKSFSLKAKV